MEVTSTNAEGLVTGDVGGGRETKGDSLLSKLEPCCFPSEEALGTALCSAGWS